MTDKQENYISSLKAKHTELERLITEESSSAIADTAKLTEMKRQKLQLKEEIEKLENQ